MRSGRKKLDIPERKLIAKSNVVFYRCETESGTMTGHAYYDSVRYIPDHGHITGETEIGSRALCNGNNGVLDESGSHWLPANAMYVEDVPKEKRCKLCDNIFESIRETRFDVQCAYCRKNVINVKDSFDEEDMYTLKVGSSHDYIECYCGFENTIHVKEDAGGLYAEVEPYVEMTEKELEDHLENNPYADY